MHQVDPGLERIALANNVKGMYKCRQLNTEKMCGVRTFIYSIFISKIQDATVTYTNSKIAEYTIQYMHKLTWILKDECVATYT